MLPLCRACLRASSLGILITMKELQLPQLLISDMAEHSWCEADPPHWQAPCNLQFLLQKPKKLARQHQQAAHKMLQPKPT